MCYLENHEYRSLTSFREAKLVELKGDHNTLELLSMEGLFTGKHAIMVKILKAAREISEVPNDIDPNLGGEDKKTLELKIANGVLSKKLTGPRSYLSEMLDDSVVNLKAIGLTWYKWALVKPIHWYSSTGVNDDVNLFCKVRSRR